MQGLPCTRPTCENHQKKITSWFGISWSEPGPTASDTSLASIAAAGTAKTISFGNFILATSSLVWGRKSWLRQLLLPRGGSFGLCCCFCFGFGFFGWLGFFGLRPPNIFTVFVLAGTAPAPLIGNTKGWSHVGLICRRHLHLARDAEMQTHELSWRIEIDIINIKTKRTKSDSCGKVGDLCWV